MKRKVLNRKQLPTKMPLYSTIMFIMAMDYYNAAGWVWGVVLTLLTITWISSIYNLTTEQKIDLYEPMPDFKDIIEKPKSKFAQRLEEAQRIQSAK